MPVAVLRVAGSVLAGRLLLIAAAPLLGCLQTPPTATEDDVVRHDAEPRSPDAVAADALAPDATPLPPCAGGECEQLLAIGLWQRDPDTASSVALFRRDAAAGSWQRLPDAPDSSDGNIFDLDWGDCCGPAGHPDGLPDLLAANFYYLRVSQLRRPNQTYQATAFTTPPQNDSPGGGAQGLWFDVDKDGRLDILTGLPNLRWHRNVPPTLEVAQHFAEPTSLDAATARIALGSWDDEAEDELLLVDRRDPAGTPAGRGTAVLDHTGTGWDSFQPVLPLSVDNAIWCDVFDDEHPDLVVASYWDMDVYPNLGSAVNGNWLDTVASRDFDGASQVFPPFACGDIDGDGGDDLLVATDTGLRAVMHGSTVPGATTVVWDPASVATEQTYISDIIVVDLDHDGRPEILVTLGDDVGPAEPAAEPVAYLLPNLSTTPGTIAIGTPEILLSAKVDGMSLAFTEFVPPAPPLR